jgi:hypothetical protein
MKKYETYMSQRVCSSASEFGGNDESEVAALGLQKQSQPTSDAENTIRTSAALWQGQKTYLTQQPEPKSRIISTFAKLRYMIETRCCCQKGIAASLAGGSNRYKVSVSTLDDAI